MIPLYSPEEVRKADEFAIRKLKIPGQILMENAAISIVNSIFEAYPYIDYTFTFGIICGKGNNGGDGFAVARQLLIRGFNVNVLSIGDEKSLKGDALSNFIILKNFITNYPNSNLQQYKSLSNINKILNCDIIVDAMLGTGSSGQLKEPYISIVHKANNAQSLRISIDLPTGLDLNTATGEVIFNANLTITLAALKTGLFYEKGKLNSGKVLKGSIGIGNNFFESTKSSVFLIEPEDALINIPQKTADQHKYSAGKVVVIAGSDSMPGAAFFSTNAVMMSGAGAGKLVFPKSMRQMAQSRMNSATVFGYTDQGSGKLSVENYEEIEELMKWADSIVIGPGLGRDENTKDCIIRILQSNVGKDIVIDADAINAICKVGFKKLNLSNFVFTPHHQEFADLLGISINELKQDLLKNARDFTKKSNSYLVLKGAPTIICNPTGEVFINTAGNVGLAKFGSGDVLTGLIGSFIAQSGNIEASIISAVYIHSLSADLILKKESEFGITPDKLIDQIPKTIKFLRKSIV